MQFMGQDDKDRKIFELGQKLQAFYDQGYVSRKQAILFSFVKGIAGGAGAFIGGTLVIALLLWILSLFGQFPFVGHIADTIKNTLHR